jgi:hypothetical protein
MRRIWMAVFLVVAGCDGIDLEQLVKQHPPLSLFTEEPVGANCARGGLQVRTGLDVDGDGTLDDSEVKTTEYACASDFPGVEVRTQTLPPGAECPHGGQRIRAGHDLNGNGQLEDAEVTREMVSCREAEAVVTRTRAISPEYLDCPGNSTAVEAGPDLDRDGLLDDDERRAQRLLCAAPADLHLRQTELPSSEGCPVGSTRVDVLQDLDSDGTLEDAEVMERLHVCRPLQTFEGTYVVRDAADLLALQGISHLRGSLVLTALSLPEVHLPHLMTVDTAIDIRDNPGLRSLRMEGLRFVQRDLAVSDNPLLETLVVGALESGPVWLGSHLRVERNARLTDLAGLNAVSPARGVTLEDNAQLQIGGSFDHLQELSGNVVLRNNPRLQALPFTQLTRVGGSLDILNNDALVSLAGSPLRAVEGDFNIQDNDALTEISGLSTLTSIGGTLDIRDNAHLRNLIGLRELQRVRSIFIVGNPQLDSGGEFVSLRTLDEELYIAGNARLAAVGTFGTVQRVGTLTLTDNPLLTSLVGLFHLQNAQTLHVHNNAALQSLFGLDGLQAVADLRLTSNAQLRYLALDSLRWVTREFIITDNPSLPTCRATALKTRAFSGLGEPVITGNDNTASCD